MRTGRVLTVSGGGGRVHPRRIFWGGKEIEKKGKKNLEDPPQKNSGNHPLKIADTPPKFQTPPKKFQTPHRPPRKFQTPTPPQKIQTSHWDQARDPPRGQTDTSKLITLAGKNGVFFALTKPNLKTIANNYAQFHSSVSFILQ